MCPWSFMGRTPRSPAPTPCLASHQGALYHGASPFPPHVSQIQPLLLAGLLAILMHSLKTACEGGQVGRPFSFPSFVISNITPLRATAAASEPHRALTPFLTFVCGWGCPALASLQTWPGPQSPFVNWTKSPPPPPKSAVPRGHSWFLLLLHSLSAQRLEKTVQPQPFWCLSGAVKWPFHQDGRGPWRNKMGLLGATNSQPTGWSPHLRYLRRLPSKEPNLLRRETPFLLNYPGPWNGRITRYNSFPSYLRSSRPLPVLVSSFC